MFVFVVTLAHLTPTVFGQANKHREETKKKIVDRKKNLARGLFFQNTDFRILNALSPKHFFFRFSFHPPSVRFVFMHCLSRQHVVAIVDAVISPDARNFSINFFFSLFVDSACIAHTRALHQRQIKKENWSLIFNKRVTHKQRCVLIENRNIKMKKKGCCRRKKINKRKKKRFSIKTNRSIATTVISIFHIRCEEKKYEKIE